MKKSWKSNGMLALVLCLTACQTLEGPGASLPPPRPLNQPAGLGAWLIPVDVDPLHGSAFERAQPEDGLRPLVAFPDVTHDLETGRTTVTLSLTHAGAAPALLSVEVQSDRPLLTSPAQLRLGLVAPGSSLALPLVFENPNAGGFPLTLSLRAEEAPGAEAAGDYALQQQSGGWVATASNSLGTLVPGHVIDGNSASQWANEAYRAPSAWLAVDTGARRQMAAVRLKLAPFSGGASYRIEVSDDGRAWRSVSGPLRNTSWHLETKPLQAPTQARHLRLVFTNDPAAPESRFSVFEVGTDFQVVGAAPTPSPVPLASPSPTPTATPSAASPAPTPVSTPSPSPTPGVPASPSPTGVWRRNFETDAFGSDPTDFVDPLDEGYAYPWMPRVPWRINAVNGSRQYVHDGLANLAFLSFRRWRGNALGTPDGRLPERYFTELDVTPLRSYTYAPTGDQGTQVYYLDPLNYLEVLIKPDFFEVWSATNAAPFQSRGWSRLYWSPMRTAAGQLRRLGAEVDARNGWMRVLVDGAELATVRSAVLTPQPHWYALRGAGNIVAHDNIRIERR